MVGPIVLALRQRIPAIALLMCAACQPRYCGAHAIQRSGKSRPAARVKEVALPFAAGTEFVVHQGPCGTASHHQPGNEYAWDMDVSYGTPVLAVESGVVIDVYAPGKGGGCDSHFADSVHNVKVEHGDGTVAQYLHVDAKIDVGDSVQRADAIAVTARNGFICKPHLHLSVYRSKQHMYGSAQPMSLPLRFSGLGRLREGDRRTVP